MCMFRVMLFVYIGGRARIHSNIQIVRALVRTYDENNRMIRLFNQRGEKCIILR